MEKQKLIAQFVNLYRQAWGTTAGLDAGNPTGKVQSMTADQLKRSIYGLENYIKAVK